MRGFTFNFPTPTKMTTFIHVNELEEVHLRTSAAVLNSLLAPPPPPPPPKRTGTKRRR